jgi:hypothetical protein
MARVEFRFRTEAEAIAFRRGVEYVNDSAVEAHEPVKRNGEWVLEVDDEDEAEDE